MIKCIEIERKQLEIESTEEKIITRKSRMLAEAEALKARQLAKAEAAETMAKLRIEKANLEAEEKLLGWFLCFEII